MSLTARREYMRMMRDRYVALGTKKDRNKLLDEIVASTGYHRKYACHRQIHGCCGWSLRLFGNMLS